MTLRDGDKPRRQAALLLLMAALAAAPAGASPVPGAPGAPGPEPIRCAPCAEPADCPAVPADCRQLLREPGCGCCMACALERGASCGVHTAHCAHGLRCTPRPGEPRPLHALTRGQGVCTEDLDPEDAEGVPDHGSLHFLLGLNLPLDQQDPAEGQESLKAKVNAIRSKLVQQGPCHTELHAALDLIATSQQNHGFTAFYLPNCDKHGFFKAKQCESSLVGPPARCWCVSSWNGKKLPGTGDLVGNAECHQEVTH